MEAKGSIVDHEYKIERGRQEVAEVSKRWFRVRDTTRTESTLLPAKTTRSSLAVIVCIDQMSHDAA